MIHEDETEDITEEVPASPGTDVEVHRGPIGQAVVSFTESELDALRDVIGSDMSPGQFTLFIAQSQRLGLDPISKQCYGWVDRGKLVMMTSIDGLRVVCQRTGKFRGMIGPQWCGADGVWTTIDEDGAPSPWLAKEPPQAARVGILHADYDAPVWGIATLAQYGRTTGLWSKGGTPHMLAKCAEAIARRSAFPQDLSGVYTDDEIDTVKADRVDKPRRPARQSTPRVEPAPQSDIERILSMFYALPDEGIDKVEQRWQTMLEGWTVGDRPGSVDDGGLFEVPESWFRPMEALIVKAIQHYQVEPFPIDDEVVDGELVEEGATDEGQ